MSRGRTRPTWGRRFTPDALAWEQIDSETHRGPGEKDMSLPGVLQSLESTRGWGHPSAPTAVADGAAGGLPASRLRRVTQYIDENLPRQLRLAELGALAH